MLAFARCPRTFCSFVLAGLVSFGSRSAWASSCASPAGFDPCFDANALWLPGGAAKFVALPDTRLTSPMHWSFGIATELSRGLVQLRVPSPDATGREIRVVDYVSDATGLFAVGLIPDLELSGAFAVRAYASGSGVNGITTQSGSPLMTAAFRDPRLSLAYSFDNSIPVADLGVRLGLDVSLPFGDDHAFAGEQSVAGGPGGTVSYRFARVSFSAGAGLRLRRALDFGGVRLGNQAFTALGVGFDAFEPGALFFGLEANALPALGASHTHTLNSPATSATLIPAEWLASVSSSLRSSHWSIRVAGGAGLPLSSETTPTQTTHFAGLTSPEFRFLLSARFTPSAR